MTNSGQGMMIVLSSPSGAGKTTLARLLDEKNIDFSISVSHTTRIPRLNEVEGKDYYFVKKDRFKELIKDNSFFEYATVFNNLYGTTKKPVIEELSKGNSVIFDIDWQGAKQIKEKIDNYKLITFFILPPSTKALEERLYNRELEDKSIIKERMSQFKADVLHWVDYDYIVINNDLDKCYDEISKIISLEKKGLKANFDRNNIEKKIKDLIF